MNCYLHRTQHNVEGWKQNKTKMM